MSDIRHCNIGTLPLDSGAILSDVNIAYTSYGALNDDCSNVVLVFHALTGDSCAAEWWSGLIGEGKILDPTRDYIICFNSLGSCYGSTGPLSIEPTTGNRYGKNFPRITTHDIARSQLLALKQLGINNVRAGIGGSMGAMVLLELALLAPDLLEKIIPIACGASHTAWRIAFSSVIRKTIERVANAYGSTEQGYIEGMKLARQLGMISYRSSGEFEQRFAREHRDGKFEVEHYLEHQGEKIAARFSPYSYLRLSEAMESYNISQRIREIICKVLVVGIDSDILYPEQELSAFSSSFPKSDYKTLSSPFGHDSFLVAQDQLARLVSSFVSVPSYSTMYHEALL